MPTAELAAALEHRSGLLGLAGTADMREVLARRAPATSRARLALDVYLHRLARWHRRDGRRARRARRARVHRRGREHAAGSAAARGRAGVPRRRLDAARNASARPATARSAPGSPGPATFVIAAREDLEIARQVREILGP